MELAALLKLRLSLKNPVLVVLLNFFEKEVVAIAKNSEPECTDPCSISF